MANLLYILEETSILPADALGLNTGVFAGVRCSGTAANADWYVLQLAGSDSPS